MDVPPQPNPPRPRPRTHPDDQALLSYASGLLDQNARDSIRRHLEECADCLRRASKIHREQKSASPSASSTSDVLDVTILTNLKKLAQKHGSEMAEVMDVPTPPSHPDDKTLLSYSQGRLNDLAGQSVRAHLETC